MLQLYPPLPTHGRSYRFKSCIAHHSFFNSLHGPCILTRVRAARKREFPAAELISPLFRRTQILIEEVEHILSVLVQEPDVVAGFVEEKVFVLFRCPQEVE